MICCSWFVRMKFEALTMYCGTAGLLRPSLYAICRFWRQEKVLQVIGCARLRERDKEVAVARRVAVMKVACEVDTVLIPTWYCVRIWMPIKPREKQISTVVVRLFWHTLILTSQLFWPSSREHYLLVSLAFPLLPRREKSQLSTQTTMAMTIEPQWHSTIHNT